MGLGPLMPMRLHFIYRMFAVWLITLTTVLFPVQVGWGQLPIPQQQSQVVLPSHVTRYGNIETTDVVFDGKSLFTIASPTVRDRNNANKLIPVEIRAELIEANLRRIVAPYTQNLLDNREPKVIISVATLNNETVILGRTEDQKQNITILTVTELDSSYNGIPIPELAEAWRGIIQNNLQEAISQRTPKALLGQIYQAVQALIFVLFISLILLGLQYFINRRKLYIQKQIMTLKNTPKQPEQPSPNTHGLNRQRIEFINHIKSYFDYEHRKKVISLFEYILLWIQFAVWLAGVSYILAIFPQTRAVANQLLHLPILWLSMWFVTGLGSKAGDFLIDRLQQAWEKYNLFETGELTRKSLRISTTMETLRGVKNALIYFIRTSYILNTLGVPISSIFALGGLIALAISLGSQNVIKDIINGLLILWEDQFGIGDIVQIGEYTGMVESMSLRITQLRNPEGCLITIPNSSIIKVSNLTRLWSRVNFEILVDCQTDPTQALQVLKKVTQEFYADPDWRQSLMEFPEVLGIDAAGHEGLLLRVWLKTQPGQQWLVGREFRRRVVQSLAQNGIALGRPHQVWEDSDAKYRQPT